MMSRIEELARPMLYAMLNGRGRTLHQTGQARLAAWALKTALMAENTQPLGGRAFPRHLYVHLYEAREPSEDLRIWLTTYTGDYAGVLHLYGLDLDDRQDGSRDERDIYGATVGMGPVAFQIYGTTEPALADPIERWPWPNVYRIWPYAGSSITWVPTYALDNGALTEFADMIAAALLQRANVSAAGDPRDP